MEQNLLEIFDRTISNCEFYEKEKDYSKLLNEIGCLRGIAYCLEAVGVCCHTEKFLYFIEQQNKIFETLKN